MKDSKGTLVLLGLVFTGLLIAQAILRTPPKTLARRLAAFRGFSLLASPATPTPVPTPTPTITPTPTPRPLTFAEMNQLYGPCAYVPTLFYHHIQDMATAKAQGHPGLTVADDMFRKHLEYIRSRGYTPIRPPDLINFFDSGTPLPAKPILLTFDDGYEDFGQVAAPMLREYGFAATAFIPTGLIENPGYMNWGKIMEINGWGTVYFANHTWSHHNVATTKEVDEREIGTADRQLADRGLNPAKVFAYPYGFPSVNGEQVLQSLGYRLAFTTYPGATLCKKQRYMLPRIRIGNAPLSAYGL